MKLIELSSVNFFMFLAPVNQTVVVLHWNIAYRVCQLC